MRRIAVLFAVIGAMSAAAPAAQAATADSSPCSVMLLRLC